MTDGIAFHTPDHDGGETVCMRLSLPSLFWRYFYGAFGELCEAYNWLQVGTMTPFEASQVFIDAMDAMRPCNMIGQIVAFVSGWIPENVLLCDGSNYLNDSYPELANVLPTQFQLPDGTFNTPDLRGRFILGNYDDERWMPGDVGGEKDHTLSVPEMPEHWHAYTPPMFNVDVEPPAGAPDILAAGIGVSEPTGTAGGGQPHNNLPPFYIVVYGIVAK